MTDPLRSIDEPTFEDLLTIEVQRYNHTDFFEYFCINVLCWKIFLMIIFLLLMSICLIMVTMGILYLDIEVTGGLLVENFELFMHPISLAICLIILAITIYVRAKVIKRFETTFIIRKDEVHLINAFWTLFDWAAISFFTAIPFEWAPKHTIQLDKPDFETAVKIYSYLENNTPLSYGDYIKADALKDIDFETKKRLLKILIKLGLFYLREEEHIKRILKTPRKNLSALPPKKVEHHLQIDHHDQG